MMMAPLYSLMTMPSYDYMYILNMFKKAKVEVVCLCLMIPCGGTVDTL
jgi:hypothetical protein